MLEVAIGWIAAGLSLRTTNCIPRKPVTNASQGRTQIRTRVIESTHIVLIIITRLQLPSMQPRHTFDRNQRFDAFWNKSCEIPLRSSLTFRDSRYRHQRLHACSSEKHSTFLSVFIKKPMLVIPVWRTNPQCDLYGVFTAALRYERRRVQDTLAITLSTGVPHLPPAHAPSKSTVMARVFLRLALSKQVNQPNEPQLSKDRQPRPS